MVQGKKTNTAVPPKKIPCKKESIPKVSNGPSLTETSALSCEFLSLFSFSFGGSGWRSCMMISAFRQGG